MNSFLQTVLFFIVLLSITHVRADDPVPESEAIAFLDRISAEMETLTKISSEADWNYATNITDFNSELSVNSSVVLMNLLNEAVQNASIFRSSLSTYTADTSRQLELLLLMGGDPKDPDLRRELKQLISDMEGIYSIGQVDGLSLDAIDQRMSASRDPAELLRLWKGWHDHVGIALKSKYARYVELMNQGARDYGYTDAAAFWKSGYDMSPEEFEAMADHLYVEVKDAYVNLHCYARHKLGVVYGQETVPPNEPIPAHLLGNMWAQDWSALFDILQPYPNKPLLDLDQPLKDQGYNASSMHRLSEAFYVSLGMDPLPESFWNKSMLVHPAPPTQAVCHASAWDFFHNDLRIKMCTQVTGSDLLVIFHEQGHLYYDHAYRNQKLLYRGGANDGFHEAIGDTIRLSVTPSYLQQVGLLPSSYPVSDEEADINAMMKLALEKLPIAPFAYLLDKWRWAVFEDRVKPDNYTQEWERLRRKYQGVVSPVPRTSDNFDPGAKYHVPASVPYVRYFLANIYQFQFHQALCQLKGWRGPLHECSIYQSTTAGDAFQRMLSTGASQAWRFTLMSLTNKSQASHESLLSYLSPLITWIKSYNQQHGLSCGWPETPPIPTVPPTPAAGEDSDGFGASVWDILLVILLAAGVLALTSMAAKKLLTHAGLWPASWGSSFPSSSSSSSASRRDSLHAYTPFRSQVPDDDVEMGSVLPSSSASSSSSTVPSSRHVAAATTTVRSPVTSNSSSNSNSNSSGGGTAGRAVLLVDHLDHDRELDAL